MVATTSGATSSGMRPRANTIAHIDNATLGAMKALDSPAFHTDLPIGIPHPNIAGLPGVGNHHYRGMSSSNGNHGKPHVLPKLQTKAKNLEKCNSRTAPLNGPYDYDDVADNLYFGGSTINPAQLHFSNSPQVFGFDSPISPFQQGYPTFPPHSQWDRDAWVNSFDHQMSFGDEQALENSSPSAVDSASPAAMSEMMVDGSNTGSNMSDWHYPFMSPGPFSGYSMDNNMHQFPDFPSGGLLSPKASLGQMTSEQFFPIPATLPSNAPPTLLPSQYLHGSDNMTTSSTSSNSASSTSSNDRKSSVTSTSTNSITHVIRQTLINDLSKSNSQVRSTSKPSPCKMSSSTVHGKTDGPLLPETHDLQRYVSAYLTYFHPHLPFLHTATLSFDATAFTSDITSCTTSFSQRTVVGGGGSLILAMAAIGALYEHDVKVSKDLAEMAMSMIQLYLQEHRQAEKVNSVGGNTVGIEMNSRNTPLWLVQAMLLTVIYGHNSGDKLAAGIANTHCAALMSLARGADLVKPTSSTELPATFSPNTNEPSMLHDDPVGWNGYISHPSLDLEKEWRSWKVAEERKRTLYAIFIFSSLLVSAYNNAPAIMNSEILLKLPCDEQLWNANSAESWRSIGGSTSQPKDVSFANALSTLLSASQGSPQRQRRMSKPFESSGIQLESLPELDLRPSTFGCLILINALHNYIWETRQHHTGEWSQHDNERLHAHVEPALRAWQAAWSCNSNHSLERPNPFGASSLSADCIPLLDLAYVRLFVDLGKSKELFFQRDWDAMANELATGSGIVQHAEHQTYENASMTGLSPAASSASDQGFVNLESHDFATAPNGGAAHSQCSVNCTTREHRLRQAASYAANSLMMSDRLGVTFADFNSRELPLQSALCAFDCAQILAEWVSTIQQRVGRYLGLIGKDHMDLRQAPACMLLDEDDCKLLEKVQEILANAEMKLSKSVRPSHADAPTASDIPELEQSGYGSKILSIHARMFEREAVWPGKQPISSFLMKQATNFHAVCREMSHALRTQATHIRSKAEASLNNTL